MFYAVFFIVMLISGFPVSFMIEMVKDFWVMVIRGKDPAPRTDFMQQCVLCGTIQTVLGVVALAVMFGYNLKR
jgi:hypothetical protein